MTNPATTANVWEAINKEIFAVLGMVTQGRESRTVSIVYIVKNQRLYIGTGLKSWKARHIMSNPSVSVTIPIAKRIPLLPWINIPQATISFSGTAKIIPGVDADGELLHSVFRHVADDQEEMEKSCLIEIQPEGDFITYGVGIPLMKMMNPELARGRAPVK